MSIIVKNKGTLYQIGDSLKLFPSKEEVKKNIENYQNREKFLCNVLLNKDLYNIEMTEEEQKETLSANNNDIFNNNNFDIDNIPWIISKYVFENSQEHGYKLRKGDIFKLGKYILRVRELGIDEDKRHFFFENKNTQKFMKDRSVNNASQIALNQQGDNYISALNLNKIINVQRKENNDNNENGINNNENSHNNIIEFENNNQGSNIQIIKNEVGNNKNVNDDINNNIISIIKVNEFNNDNNVNEKNNNNENRGENNNSKKLIPIYYNNNQSQQNNENISYHASNSNKNNVNPFIINIIKSNSLENNIVVDSSKNKLNNNSFMMNSLGFNTFHNNSIMNSSMNNSGKNNNSIINENEMQHENNKKNIIKNTLNALKSTASFKKKKLTYIIQNKLIKNSITGMEINNNKPICRICLSEEYEESNPLIHPCNCDGTMKYIHLQCLKLLIQSKIKKTETESCKVLTFKTLECEICKMVFPEKIRIKDSIFSIIDLEKPDKDYIIFDGLIKETPEEKSIFIVHFKNKKEIKIGRATDANIRLNDISVSRAHAIISQYNDCFYLHDTNSKFGTLISLGNKFSILYNKPFSVQKGNILFQFLMKKTLCATLRCYHPSVILYKTYNDFLDSTYICKYNTKDEVILIHEKTKTVSEYSSEAIIKLNKMQPKSSKNIDFFENNEDNESIINSSKKNNNNSLISKEDNKNSINKSNNHSNSNRNNNNIENDENNNISKPILFDSFKINKEKDNNNNNNNNNDANYQSFGINKTQELSREMK